MSDAPRENEATPIEGAQASAPQPADHAAPDATPPAPAADAPDVAAEERAAARAAAEREAAEKAAAAKAAAAKEAAAKEAAAIEKEVSEAMSGMASGDLAEMTLGASPSAESSDDADDVGVQLGRIEAIHGDDVFISLGQKTQGVISKSQFTAKETVAVGEPVEVVVDRYDRENDLLILSRKGRARNAAWDLLKPGDIVEGRIVGLNRGGLEVQLKGIKAFLPASQVDVMHVKDISIFLNEMVRCEVLEIDRRGKSLTVSRRKILEKERAEKRDELVKELEVGQVRKGVVGNLTDFGAFVDLGGVDGLIHISDLSHKQVKRPADVVKTGDVVEVKVLKIQDDKGKQRISLGLKQTQPDPWTNVENRFAVGSTHRVRVVRLADFGAFAELEEGVEGLIPISEMSYSRIGKPSEVVEVGQTVDACVLRVEPNKHRIALSIKQAQPDPWAEVIEGYTPDSMVDGKVTRLADFGAFVELAPGVEGMIHISELSDKRVRACSDVVKVGQEVKARVVKVDPQNRRIGLSLKPAGGKDAVAAEAIDFGKSKKPKKKDRKLRGGLSSDWDWAGAGLNDLHSGPGA
ncbi:MAG: S1 RNA-binding domain-containing protein [Phycisphaerales bacterium]|nr:S1 RNA-binding domain-containing protein [Phycisphaerales bacterium]